ncbi:MAG TPA: DUF1345 domain-containing protein [Pseudolabrys sp.]|jgi:uncharacterized membrane protein
MAENKSMPLSAPRRPMPIRMARLHARLLIAAVVSIAVIVIAPSDLRLPTRLLAGWNIGIVCYLVMTHWVIWRCDIAHLRKRASEQDEGAFVILLLSMAGALASLVALVFEIGGAKQAPHEHVAIHVLLAMATILLSWAFMHTIFSLHYAHEYYGEGRDKKIGGLNFPGDGEPDYWDFLYFSLVIGMTSQVSDVTISSKVIRRMAALHGVLSFFFNLTILALTVNMISNLL